MAYEEKNGAAGTSGKGDSKDGAGNDGDLSKESPAELARIIADLRKENAATRKKQRELEQGEFKTLAEQRAAKIEALNAKAAKAEPLEGQIRRRTTREL